MIVRQKIAVTGASGQLGQALQTLGDSFPQFQFIFLSSDDLDLQDAAGVNRFFAESSPEFFINCAAYTAVDKAEEEKELAYAVNAEAVKFIAEKCLSFNTKLIHLSTDYIFDGVADDPYTEDSQANPLNVYGASKLAGEKNAINANPGSIIVRTSWVYSEFGKNFVKTMIRLMSEKKELKIVSDQFGSPTYARDLAEVIMEIINHDQWQPGIFHFSNEGVISWYEFAVAIKELTDANCKLEPISTEQYKTPARRPLYCVLDKTLIQSTYGIQLKNWKDALRVCISNMAARS